MATILIVDDSATEVYRLSEILKKEGHTLSVAHNGLQGIEMAKQLQPDLILMDVVMPQVNGFQATRRLTRDQATSHIPVILVTTKDEETDKIWGRRQGAKDYLTKPVDEVDLLSSIEKILVS